jgi:hypothetical protein
MLMITQRLTGMIMICCMMFWRVKSDVGFL